MRSLKYLSGIAIMGLTVTSASAQQGHQRGFGERFDAILDAPIVRVEVDSTEALRDLAENGRKRQLGLRRSLQLKSGFGLDELERMEDRFAEVISLEMIDSVIMDPDAADGYTLRVTLTDLQPGFLPPGQNDYFNVPVVSTPRGLVIATRRGGAAARFELVSVEGNVVDRADFDWYVISVADANNQGVWSGAEFAFGVGARGLEKQFDRVSTFRVADGS
ncbi:MAG: hypothetical protein ACFB2Z_01960 [Maricaulaceae bacterium]